MMKLIVALSALIALAFYQYYTKFYQNSQDFQTLETGNLIDNIAHDFEDANATDADKQKVVTCLVSGKNEVTDIVAVAKSLVAKKYLGALKDLYTAVKQIFDVVDKCKSLFCFAPTFAKCEKANSQGCEKTGLVVYPKCRSGFTNWGCCVCASICPPEFTDNGLYCLKPRSYGRGAGYVLWQRSKCEQQNSQGCEKNGLIWYPKCRAGFHNVGCCVCSPNCPSGWTDIGISCKKPESYGRGVGYAVTFGTQCLAQENQSKLSTSQEDLEQKCVVLLSKINTLQLAVDFKFQAQQKNVNDYQYGLSDEVKQLAMQVKLYADQGCSIKKQ